jgi:DNA-binding CsgD family transcriptional regulator
MPERRELRSQGAGVHEASTARPNSIVGREPELEALRLFVEGDPYALVLAGGPGFGKTTLWEAGIAAARERRVRVLSARPSEAEAQLSFAALIDLLDQVDAEELDGLLPAPQRRALDVALLRAEPAGEPPQPHAIAVGFLNVLRGLAAAGPLVVAVDDVPWLDRPSGEALAFAARRLHGNDARFLLARRPGEETLLEQALEEGRSERLEVGPLSLGATRTLLSERLGLTLPRLVLRRIVASTLGNPLFALELGRIVAAHGPLGPGEDIPVPDAVEDLLGTRVAELEGPVRRLLLAVALSGDLRASELAAIGDATALDRGVAAGLLVLDRDRVRASHPLLAAASRRHSSAAERRELHLALAGVMADAELRARHLALATEHPDEALAAVVARAAASASARGARQEAAELAEHALRLTPPESATRSDRLLTLAEYLDLAGELQRVSDLLRPELDSLPPGDARVHAWLALAESGSRSLAELEHHLESALAESGDDPGLRALVLAKKADHAAASAVSRIRDAEAWADEALRDARPEEPEVEQVALLALAWARSLRGRPIDDLCKRFSATSYADSYITSSPLRVAGQRHVWRGEVSEARETFTRFLALADERGELLSYTLQRLHLCELELRIGDWDAAARLLDEWGESSEGELLIWPMYERCRALLAAGRGLPDEAERWAAVTIDRAEAIGGGWDLLEGLRARGLAALLSRRPEEAVDSLQRVWEHMLREGVDEPGVFPVAPDLVDALVELGERDEARAVTERLAHLAVDQDHPWGLATAARCDGLVRLAGSAYDERAAGEVVVAAARFDQLGLRFDGSRCLLALGGAQRRAKRWAAARGSLGQAAAGFDRIGSAGWAEAARAELARLPGRRRAAPGELTPTERRVVDLAVDGLSNKEIALQLVVTVHTVEAHLSHAYAKLGISSRRQLPRRLGQGLDA